MCRVQRPARSNAPDDSQPPAKRTRGLRRPTNPMAARRAPFLHAPTKIFRSLDADENPSGIAFAVPEVSRVHRANNSSCFQLLECLRPRHPENRPTCRAAAASAAHNPALWTAKVLSRNVPGALRQCDLRHVALCRRVSTNARDILRAPACAARSLFKEAAV